LSTSRLRPAWFMAGAAVIIWTFSVIVGYYIVHKPFGPNSAAALLRTALDIAIWLLMLAAATGLGWWVIRRFLGQAVMPLEGLVLSCGLGLGILSLLTLALGLAGGLKSWLIWLLIAAITAVGVWPLRDLLKRVKGSGLLHAETRFERLLLIYVLLALVPAFLSALAPPIAWDSQVYHLTGPKLYIEQGRITGGIDIPYLGFPALVETLFTAAMLLKSTAVAKLVHFTYGLLSLLSIYALAQRYLTRRAGLLGMAILAAAPTIMLIASWAYVDLALLFYELAAFYLLLLWAEGSFRDQIVSSQEGLHLDSSLQTPAAQMNEKVLLLVGVFSGFAIGVKYTAVLLPATLAAVVLWSSRKEGWRLVLRRGLLIATSTALVAAPWFLRNWAFTGNPVYPFFLPGRYWDAFRAWFYSRPGTGLASTAPWRLLIAPWEATIYGLEGAEGYSASISPLFLLALPLLLLTWRSWTRSQRRLVGLMVIVCAPQYCFWLYGVAQSALLHQTRLLFPIFGFLALLAGFALDRIEVLDRPQFSLARFLSGVVLVVLGLDLLSAGLRFVHSNPLAHLAGYQTAQDYVRRYQPDYQQAVEYVNEELPPSAKIYFLWEPRSYYSERDVRPDAILDGFLHLRYRFGDAAAINRYLLDEDFTHLLLHRRGMEFVVEAGFDPVTPDDLAVLQELQDRYWSPVDEWGDAYVLYELVP
jgi:hypothetical protein